MSCTLLRPLGRSVASLRQATQIPPAAAAQNSRRRRFASSIGEAAPKAGPEDKIESIITESNSDDEIRYPRAIQAIHLKPLRREAEYGVPSCDLQMRSYSIRNLEFFADFALRAAYYLGLPAFGPIPLPHITERWTVPRSHFIFKKSQENFERITMRRLIQIRDGHPDSVQLWLAFLQKHAYYGIGMKANVWEFSKLSAGDAMDKISDETTAIIDSTFEHLGQHKTLGTVEKVGELLKTRRFKKMDRWTGPE